MRQHALYIGDMKQPVDKELFEGGKIQPIAQFWPMEKSGEPSALHRRVHLGGAHSQLSSQFGAGRAPGVRRNDLQGRLYVLRLQHHDSILYSRIANREYLRLATILFEKRRRCGLNANLPVGKTVSKLFLFEPLELALSVN
jgi:hypothetical protein